MDIVELNDQAKQLFDNKLYFQALELLSSFELPVELLPNLAKCYYYTNQAHIAIDIIKDIANDQNLKIDLALYNSAIGNFDIAFDIYNSLDLTDPRVQFNLGWYYIKQGKFLRGFESIEAGRCQNIWGSSHLYYDKLGNLWNKQKCQRLVLLCEGGLGDNIIFVRWANHLKQYCDNLTVLCDDSLIRLFTNSGYDALPISALGTFEYDYFVPAMSLPYVLQLNNPKEYVTFPYITSHVEQFITHQFQSIEGLKIGIKWQGNKEFDGDLNRTLPKEKLFELQKYGTLFSLQLDEDVPGLQNCNWMIRDWTDTYAVVKNLDLVVTSCTSIAHLCGAIGTRCIVLTPIMCYMCWANDQQPWYDDNIKVFKQTTYHDWNPVFDELFMFLDAVINR